MSAQRDGTRETASRRPRHRSDLARHGSCPAGFFVLASGRSDMANHLTPDELSKEVGIERDEVIRICLEEHVPIYQGKIDKFLFQTQLEALGALPHH
jgi:hypothetical protein